MSKKYVVYQDKYGSYGYGYGVYDPSDPESSKPNKFDVVEQFEAEEGAEWFGYDVLTIHIDKEDIEKNGYTVEQLQKMFGNGLYKAVYACLPDPEKEFSDWEKGGCIIECDEDKVVEAYDLDDESDCVVVYVEIKYKFTLSNGEVKFERIK